MQLRFYERGAKGTGYIYIYNKDGVFLYYYYSVWGRKKGKRKYGFDSCVVEV
jgi:hypothetical protein